MVNIAIFASGSGSNAERIAHYFSDSNHVNIALILCNKQDAFVFERAKKLGIEALFLNKGQMNDSTVLLPVLQERSIDFVVLAGYLLLIPRFLIQAFPSKIVNIHPALLPNYGGKGMYGMHVHQAVIQNKESSSGITIHFVNEQYDEGGIILQAHCELNATDTPESLAQKIHFLEHRYFPIAIEHILEQQFGIEA